MSLQGRAFNNAVVKALGLEGHNVYSLSIDCEVDRPAIVRIEEFLLDGQELVPLLSEYMLVPRPGAVSLQEEA